MPQHSSTPKKYAAREHASRRTRRSIVLIAILGLLPALLVAAGASSAQPGSHLPGIGRPGKIKTPTANPSSTTSAPVTAPPTTDGELVLNPVADTYVNEEAPNTPHGSRPYAYATRSVNRAFLKFDTEGSVPSGDVITAARLELYSTILLVNLPGVAVHPASSAWSEPTLTAANRPAHDPRALNTPILPGVERWVSISLSDSAPIDTDGTTSFELLYTESNSGYRFNSRESGTPPRLVLTLEAAQQSTPTPTTAAPTPPPGASPSSLMSTGPLPFDMPSRTTLARLPHLAFAHYFTPYPLSIDNQPPDADYYTRNYLNPDGENGKHAACGGLLRDRPLPRAPLPGDFAAQDLETEVRQAIAGGLDGFSVDILSLTSRNWERVVRLLEAAHRVDPSFEIMLMPDMTTLDDEDPATLASAMATLAKYPATFRLGDGRLVVSPFKAEAKSAIWWESWIARMRTEHGIDIAFVPTLLDWQRYADSFASISYGFSHWSLSNPDSNVDAAKHPEKAHAMDKLFMAPTHTQDERPCQSIYDEAGNTETLRLSWQGAIAGNTDWVNIPTWNDYSEGTHIAPSAEHGWSYLDLMSYYLVWWKTGAPPPIVRDTVYLTHRSQPYAAKPSYPQTSLMSLRLGTTPARDTVEALTFLTAPATIRLTVGGTTHTYTAPAGVSAKILPLASGSVSAAVVREGTTTTSVTSPYTVTNRPYVQDLQYHAVSSRRG